MAPHGLLSAHNNCAREPHKRRHLVLARKPRARGRPARPLRRPARLVDARVRPAQPALLQLAAPAGAPNAAPTCHRRPGSRPLRPETPARAPGAPRLPHDTTGRVELSCGPWLPAGPSGPTTQARPLEWAARGSGRRDETPICAPRLARRLARTWPLAARATSGPGIDPVAGWPLPAARRRAANEAPGATKRARLGARNWPIVRAPSATMGPTNLDARLRRPWWRRAALCARAEARRTTAARALVALVARAPARAISLLVGLADKWMQIS